MEDLGIIGDRWAREECDCVGTTADLSQFIATSYPAIKEARPDLKVLIREASGIEPRAFARFGRFSSPHRHMIAGGRGRAGLCGTHMAERGGGRRAMLLLRGTSPGDYALELTPRPGSRGPSQLVRLDGERRLFDTG